MKAVMLQERRLEIRIVQTIMYVAVRRVGRNRVEIAACSFFREEGPFPDVDVDAVFGAFERR